MKILRVIVDELPTSCEKCDVYDWYDGPMCGLIQWQRVDRDPYIWECKCVTSRHPECPLALEHDTRIADDRKVPIEQVMALKKLAKY